MRRAVACGVALWLSACGGGGSTTEASSVPCDACGGDCVEEAAPALSSRHTTDAVDYPSYPPSSGDHDPCWAPWGASTAPLRTERWVHDLEHGGVVFLYAEALPAEDVDALTAWVGTLPVGRAVLTPASEPMDAVVAAVAWEHRLLLGCLDLDALDAFFDDHVARAPEDLTADPGACAP